MKVVRTIVIDYELWMKVKELAHKKGVTVSSIIEAAVEDYLNWIKSQEK